MKIKSFFKILVTTYKNWSSNEPFQMSASVSYYALFSFPALLIIIIQTTGIFYKKNEIKGKIIREISEVLGQDVANTIEGMLKNAIDQEQSTLVIIIGIVTLLYGATGMFIALQKSLNIIWKVKPKPKNEIFKMIKDRIFSLGLILVIGFLLLTSLVLTAFITATTDWIGQHFPNFVIYVIQIINFILSLILITILFAMIFKILPDVKIKWKDVWLGAFVTTILFSIGKSALGIYFGTVNPQSTFGAAGSVILILLWVSYSSLILFFGAEFTKVLASKYGSGIHPASYAEKLS
ncbi:YihY/virulence factor BrkB family protein [Aquimarina sp. AD1]|uniref:YihY/virulence factor BrkB family protein n=1 Tax=Aquimarina sp. (strain AD1) TaxID=1714848 RepID=UPI000E492116|nr:YihY/virulence factor BrkB family protein [Aquimarina sp. AD1]AXT57189.1 YihY/virulence factor BrkB family protein [Aquimarina sp. AD1]RKN35824.1 YihY family inner membrane protein [Aquimarina sp. AD1]